MRPLRLFVASGLSTPARYGLTVLIMLVGIALQYGLHADARLAGVFLLLPGIFVAGLLFDRGSAFLAAVIAVAAAALTVGLELSGSESLSLLTLFALTSVIVAMVSEAVRSEVRKVIESDRAKSILLDELAHRTKNNLAILSAMVLLQARRSDAAVSAALKNTAGRIQVLTDFYDHLTWQEDAKQINIREYLNKVCEKINLTLGGSRPIALTIESDEVYVASQQAIPLAIIVNELATNAFKYAFPEPTAGHVSVVFRAGPTMELIVADNGVGLGNHAKEKGGLGSQIVKLLTQQLGGTLHYEDNAPGTRVSVRFPRVAA
jgi:two-component sensor histidine kinase